MLQWLVSLLIVTFYSANLWSIDFKISSIKRLVVFPAQGVDESLVDELWWQARSITAQDLRFTVATRRLMINRQVLAPRGELKTADAVLLGRILEADALISMYIKDAKAWVKVYRSEDGLLVWQGEQAFNPALSLKDQTLGLFSGLIKRFIVSVPYIGYQVNNPISGEIMDTSETHALVYIQTGGVELEIGQRIQWGELIVSQLPLFLSERKLNILVEGEVVHPLKNNLYQVQIPLQQADLLKINMMIFDANKLNPDKNDLLVNSVMSTQISSEYLVENMQPQKKIIQQAKISTYLGFIFNFLAVLLIAF